MKIKFGSTRTVILTRNYAFKLPGYWCRYPKRYSWKQFLLGLLANMQEKEFSQLKHPRLCPIKFYIPGGFLVVMPRALPISDGTWEDGFIDDSFNLAKDVPIPGELKQDSFGIIKADGQWRIVCVDYGN